MPPISQLVAHYGQIGTTAFAAGTIYSIHKTYIGRHAWDVRAIAVTDNVARVMKM